MVPTAILLTLLFLALPTDWSQWNEKGGAPKSRYSNEASGFKFYEAASWRSLEPLVATMGDVRRVLGSPEEANDMSAFTKPYPGDEKALEPVFTYRQGTEWKLLVYFAKYCFHQHPKELPGDRLCSIDLIPEGRIHFDPSKLTAAFQKTHVQAVDGAWDEYSDGSGLSYAIYTRRPQYGSHEPGDLFRISYGPPGSPDMKVASAPD